MHSANLRIGWKNASHSATAYGSSMSSQNTVTRGRMGWTTSSTGSPTNLTYIRSAYLAGSSIGTYNHPTSIYVVQVSAGNHALYLRGSSVGGTALDTLRFSSSNAVAYFIPN